VSNDGFAKWQDDAPAGWTIEVGARSGGTKPSRIAPVGGGGIELASDASIGQWRSASQKIAVPAGTVGLRLKFIARTDGLKREGRQFNCCYIGLAARDADGKRLSTQVRE
jgi:hypothetical protein